MFACVLVFMQLGFRAALFDSATSLPQALRGEFFLMHPLTQALFRTERMPRSRAFQALAVPEVMAAVPIYLAQASWRNPDHRPQARHPAGRPRRRGGGGGFPRPRRPGAGAEVARHGGVRPPLPPRIRRCRRHAGARGAVRGGTGQPSRAGGGHGGTGAELRRGRQRGAERDQFPPGDHRPPGQQHRSDRAAAAARGGCRRR